jgi:succinoglycan biosynthesis protein ExoM
MRVAICVTTFRRPKLLGELLRGLSELTFQKMPCPEITVVVSDNDEFKTAEEVCREAQLRWQLRYVSEPRRGIAHGRNRALKEAGDVDCIAFIDDDEVPQAGWLDELLWAQSEYAVDIACGPVIPNFTGDVPAWIRKTTFFDRPIYPTGRLLECCSTNNALMTRRVLDQVPGFDDGFQLTGGEDIHFFLRARRAGFQIVSSDEAVVVERIARDRANLSSLLRLAYRGGNCYTLVECSLDDRFSTRLLRLGRACGRLCAGAAGMGTSLVRGRISAVRAMRGFCRGLGMLTALVGVRYQAYKSPTGDPAT